MNELKQLTNVLKDCNTSSQLSTIIPQIKQLLLELILCNDETKQNRNILINNAFEVMVNKSIPSMPSYQINQINMKLIATHASIITDNISQLMVKIVEQSSTNISKEVITSLVILIACHSSPSYQWSSNKIHENVLKISEILLNITNCVDIKQLLNEKFSTLIKTFLTKFNEQSKNSEEWLSIEVNAYLMQYIVFNIDIKCIDAYVHQILQLSIKLVDDHAINNKLVGIKCLQLIINNCWNELRSNSSHELIYHRLRNLLFNKEVTLFCTVFECLLDIIRKLKFEANNEQILLAFTREDDIFIQIMNNIQINSDVNYRLTHLNFLNQFIGLMDNSCIKHSKSYTKLLCELLMDPITNLNYNLVEALLYSLNQYLINTWVAISQHFDICFLTLLKLSHNISANKILSDSIKSKLLSQTCDCILIMKKANIELFNQFANRIMKTESKSQLHNCILEILND